MYVQCIVCPEKMSTKFQISNFFLSLHACILGMWDTSILVREKPIHGDNNFSFSQFSAALQQIEILLLHIVNVMYLWLK